MISDKSRKATVIFKIYRSEYNDKVCIVSGKAAQTLLQLIQHGNEGITSSTFPAKLADYIHILRKKLKLEIQTQMEAHYGGKHSRYVLLSTVEVIAVYGALSHPKPILEGNCYV